MRSKVLSCLVSLALAVGLFPGSALASAGLAPVAAGELAPQLHKRTVVQVATGFASTAAVLSDGSLWMWGGLFQKDGSVPARQPIPQKVMDDVASIATHGDDYAVVKTDGSLQVVDTGYSGSAVTFTASDKLLDDVVQVSAGQWSYGAVKSDGTLWTWGRRDVFESYQDAPQQVLSGVASVSVGNYDRVAVKADGSLWALDYAERVSMGGGSFYTRYVPKQVLTGVKDAMPLASESTRGVAVLMQDGSLRIYNSVLLGKTWTSYPDDSDTGTYHGRVQYATVASGVAELLPASYDEFAFIGADGTLSKIGFGYDAEDVQPASSEVVKVADGVASAQLGVRHNAMAKTDGSLWTWGDNTWGELGDGSAADRSEPASIFNDGKWLTAGVLDDAYPIDISSAVITGLASATYTGKAHEPVPIVTLDDEELVAGTDYTVSYSDNVNAGTATVTVTGTGDCTGSASATFEIAKADNPMKVKAKKVKVKASKVSKRPVKVKAKKSFKFKVRAEGKVTYKKVKKGSSKRLSIVKKTGKVKVKKGTPAGTYRIKVEVKASGNENYKAKSKTVKVKVKVK